MAKPSETTDSVYARYADKRALGARFEAASVADLYCHRPPYSDEVFEVLEGLLVGRPRKVLDAGTGPGKIARELVRRGVHVHAVDASAEMIRAGRAAPGGVDPKLRWIHATIEDAPLDADYGLATAAASFHWFDAESVLSRLRAALAPDGLLVLLDGDGACAAPWQHAEHVVMTDFVSRLEGRRVDWEHEDLASVRVLDHPAFEPKGRRITEPAPFRQRVEDYIACQHSRASFAPDVMGAELAREFDDALRGVLEPHAADGWITYHRQTLLEWGRPI